VSLDGLPQPLARASRVARAGSGGSPETGGLVASLAARAVSRVAELSDRQLATLIGGVLAFIGGWPLLFVHLPPYQDLPDHLATVGVLLNPSRYPEFVSNGWLKANSFLVSLLFVLAKGIGLLAAGRVVPVLVVGATAFALPHFVLSFTDRRRLVVASLFMAPMVHHWWTIMGMLNFSLGFALGLMLFVVLARQADKPSVPRGFAIAGLAALLWFVHGLVLLFVGLLAVVDVVARYSRGEGIAARLRRGRAVLLPLAPMGAVTLGTIFHHRQFGHVDAVKFQPLIQAVFDLWAHWFLALSFLSAAGLVNALLLLFFALRAARARVPMFSFFAVVVLAAFYFLLPIQVPGVGYLCERALPFLWAWALVRVPDRLPRWTSRLLLASSAAWSIGLGADLLRGGADLDDFIAAAPEVPPGARLLALNFESRGSATNTWCLVHASGMYTVLRGAHPLDLWADSTSMPIMRTHAPTSFVEDPVRIREFQGVAHDPRRYCEALEQTGFSDVDCAARWRETWREFWAEAAPRYDYVLLWGATSELRATVPAEYQPRVARGALQLYARPEARELGASGVTASGPSPHSAPGPERRRDELERVP
jgi:hypothetical protein